MAFREAIRIALQSLWANKLRSILTLIGMVIGVASVIMVITLAAGANKFVATKVYGYGADVFTASKQPSVIFSDAEYMKYQKRKDLKYEAYEAIAERCDACSATGTPPRTSTFAGGPRICPPSTTSTSNEAAPSLPAKRRAAYISL
jgi:putative ABC transport system permease protein